MRLLSVNLAQPRQHQVVGKPETTGIYKVPQPGAVHVGKLGLLHDHIADVKHHGGPDQAVYLYSAQDYEWWAEQLGRALEPGTLGENLTPSSFGSETVRAGDRYRVGEVVLEVTWPRIPCATLSARMGDTKFVKKFRQARRPAFTPVCSWRGRCGPVMKWSWSWHKCRLQASSTCSSGSTRPHECPDVYSDGGSRSSRIPQHQHGRFQHSQREHDAQTHRR